VFLAPRWGTGTRTQRGGGVTGEGDHVIAPGIHHCGPADLLLRERAGEQESGGADVRWKMTGNARVLQARHEHLNEHSLHLRVQLRISGSTVLQKVARETRGSNIADLPLQRSEDIPLRDDELLPGVPLIPSGHEFVHGECLLPCGLFVLRRDEDADQRHQLDVVRGDWGQLRGRAGH